MKCHAAVAASLLSSIISPVVSQKHVTISTNSARFNLSIAPVDGTFTTNEHFQFESAMSKLFHTKISSHVSSEGADRAIATSVHVERMAAAADVTGGGGATKKEESALKLKSIVSGKCGILSVILCIEVNKRAYLISLLS